MNKLPQSKQPDLFFCKHCGKNVHDYCHEHFDPDSGKYSRTCKLCGNVILSMRIGRNEKCPCGSGKKYKNCHLNIIKDGLIRQIPNKKL